MDDLIPFAGIVMIVAIVLGPIWIGTRAKSEERARMHETLRRAFDKGQPLPPDLIDALHQEKPRASPERDFRTGVILMAVALAFLALGGALYGAGQDDEIMWVMTGVAAFPGLIGLAFLAFWLGKRGQPVDDGV